MIKTLRSIKRSTVLMLLPRFGLSYPFYLIGSIFIINFDKRLYEKTTVFLTIITLFFTINLLQYNLSITSFLLSISLQLPFILFLCGAKIKIGYSSRELIRNINLWTFILSFINLVFQGFPFNLPYIHFSPDYFSAFFGFGGAKIVTVIGFFGFSFEIVNFREKKAKFYLLIALTNFILPSYLLGIISGCAALWIYFLKDWKIKKVFLSLIIPLILCPFISSRLTGLNNDFANEVGYLPKIYSYVSVLNLYIQYPMTLITGTGIGQFTSTPALWSSDYISKMSSHSVPSFLNLTMSEFHENILGKVLKPFTSGQGYSWELSSSVNKPYSSMSTLLSEYGIFLTFAILFLVIKRLSQSSNEISYRHKKIVMFFSLIIFLMDNWHDSPWFGYLLLAINSLNYPRIDQNFVYPRSC